MKQITKKQLELIVDRINEVTGSNPVPWSTKGKKYKSNIGNFHLSWAYGGVALHRMMNESGGVTDIFSGHMTKRHLANRMWAYLSGLELKKEL